MWCLQFRRKVGQWSVGWQRGDDEEWSPRFFFFFWQRGDDEEWSSRFFFFRREVMMRSDLQDFDRDEGDHEEWSWYIYYDAVCVCLFVCHFLKCVSVCLLVCNVLSSIWRWPPNLNSDNGDGDKSRWSDCLSVTKNDHFLFGVSCNHHL